MVWPCLCACMQTLLCWSPSCFLTDPYYCVSLHFACRCLFLSQLPLPRPLLTRSTSVCRAVAPSSLLSVLRDSDLCVWQILTMCMPSSYLQLPRALFFHAQTLTWYTLCVCMPLL